MWFAIVIVVPLCDNIRCFWVWEYVSTELEVGIREKTVASISLSPQPVLTLHASG